MVTLVDPTTFTSSVNSTEGAELREIVIGEVRLVRTMLMAFVEATTTMTVVLRVDKTGLGWILLIRVVAFGLAHPDNACLNIASRLFHFSFAKTVDFI